MTERKPVSERWHDATYPRHMIWGAKEIGRYRMALVRAKHLIASLKWLDA